jgi:hypothetical protein
MSGHPSVEQQMLLMNSILASLDATLLSYFPILPDVLYMFASAKDQPQHCRDKESKSSKWQGCDWIPTSDLYRFGRGPLDSDTI